jgi:PAS domain S-box-containing protein
MPDTPARAARPWKARKIALATVAFLTAAVTLQLYDVYNVAEDDAERLISATANATGQKVSGSLRGVHTLLDEVATNVALGQHHSPAFSQWIVGALLSYPEIRFIGIVTPNGRLLPETWPNVGVPQAGEDVSNRLHFKRALRLAPHSSDIVYGHPLIGRTTGERTLHAASPVWDSRGKLLALVVASLNPDVYAGQLQAILPDADSTIGIFSRDGFVVARAPDHQANFGKDISSGEMFSYWLPRAPDGVVRITSSNDSVRKFVAYRTLNDVSLIVTTGISEEKVFRRWTRQAMGETILLLIVSALILRQAWGVDYRQGVLLGYQRRLEDAVEERTAHLAEAMATAKRMQERFHLFSLAVEQSPSAIIITNRDEQIEYVNAAFTDMTGTSLEDAVGLRPADVLKSGKTPTETYAGLRQQIDQGLPWKGKFINRKADGSNYISFATIWPVRDERDEITHYLGIQDDITAQVRAGEELDRHRHHLEDMVAQRTAELAAAKETAEGAAQAKSMFLANMSHEIRTPLNAIFGFTGILRRTAHDPQQLDKLDKIHMASVHLLGIINAILDLSKIDAGKVTILAEDFDLDRLVTGVLIQVAPQVEAKGLSLTTTIDPILPAVLHGDAMRLSQSLLNFVNNAVKFTEKGAIAIRVHHIEDRDGDMLVRFEVADSGIGIEPDDLDRLFSPFEQADGSTTRKYGGTGLGLAITRKLAELMGGEVGAHSHPGSGSQFWFTARLGHAIAEAPPPESPASDSTVRLAEFRGTARLLLAEDVPLNRHVMTDLLAEIGLTADMAEDGLQAVDIAAQNPYDLILMDMQMPLMDGLDATRAIRRLPGHAETPIVALTANAFDEDRQRCLDAGMNDHLAKPIEADDLHRMLVKWLKTETPMRATAMAACAATDDDIVARLHQCLGGTADMDLARGLKQIKKPERYVRYLLQYADTCDTHLPHLRERLEAGATDDAIRIAHSLKGASAMMAAVGLQDIAATLEQAIISGDDLFEIQRLLTELDHRSADVCRAIRQLK